MKPYTDFNVDDVQARLEAIISAGNRQVAARCALVVAEYVEAAREDERRRLGAGGRQSLSLAATTSQRARPEAPAYGAQARPQAQCAEAGSSGFPPENLAKGSSASAAQGGVLRQSLLRSDSARSENKSEDTCIQILKHSFEIRERMRAFPRSKSGHFHEEPVSQKTDPGAISEELSQRIVNMRKIVHAAVGLWQDRLLDDEPALKRRVTTMGVPERKPKAKAKMRFSCATFTGGSEASRLSDALGEASAAEAEARTRELTKKLLNPDERQPKPTPRPPENRPASPTRPVSGLKLVSELRAKADSADKVGSPARTPPALGDVQTPSPSRTPKNRKELHEDLGKELAQLAADLRSAQIITEA